jgi:hypothetical protein
MYAPSYGYAPGNASAPFTPNGVSPGAQPHNPHQQQPSQQQPQHMMYNQQQYAGTGGQQSPYGSTANGMGGNAGAMGMMQNNGMAHMAGGHGMLHTSLLPTVLDLSSCLTSFAPSPVYANFTRMNQCMGRCQIEYRRVVSNRFHVDNV